MLLEELAFRSVLWGVPVPAPAASGRCCVTTSVLFGFWHVIPALRGGETNRGVSDAVGEGAAPRVVVGTVALTTVGGLVFGELRRRSGSVLASAGAHWATNALGVLFGLLAWRLEARPVTGERSPRAGDARLSPRVRRSPPNRRPEEATGCQ